MKTPNILNSRKTPKTDLPVMLPFRYLDTGSTKGVYLSQWLSSTSPWSILLILAVILAWPLVAQAETSEYRNALTALGNWIPYLLKSGFTLNLLIAVVAMLVGTATGIALGSASLSSNYYLKSVANSLISIIRHVPWLVLLFVVSLSLPFEFDFDVILIILPSWFKASLALSLPVMVNVAVIVKEEVYSVNFNQWETAESLAFNPRQTLTHIILPQCYLSMIPKWLNLFVLITMATSLCSLIGIEEIVTLVHLAMEVETQIDYSVLVLPFFGFSLLVFLLFCFPIAKLATYLEHKHSISV